MFVKETAQAAILHNLKRRGLTLADFGQAIGRSRKTGYNIYNNPKSARIEDILLLKPSKTEILEIMGVDE